jgi:RNA recognition motif-containing protein
MSQDSKLFIGGISWEATEESLRKEFDRFGEIRESKAHYPLLVSWTAINNCVLAVEVISHRPTGRSRGFAFITYATVDQAREAVERMSGKVKNK